MIVDLNISIFILYQPHIEFFVKFIYKFIKFDQLKINKLSLVVVKMSFKSLRIPKRTIQEPKLPKGLWRNSDLGDILNLCEKTKLPSSLNTNYFPWWVAMVGVRMGSNLCLRMEVILSFHTNLKCQLGPSSFMILLEV